MLSSTITLAKEDKAKKVRVIAHTDDEVSDALAKGCSFKKNAKTLKALECPEETALEIGLEEDIKVFALNIAEQEDAQQITTQDINSNKQIGADLVQASGNSGAGRTIVILDTGYNYNHPELSSSYLGGKDFVNDDSDPFDDNGHGSHVAGLITGDGIDARAKGVAPAAGIISGKVLNQYGSGYFSDVVAAIYWAVDGYDGVYGTADDFKADAISMSLGTSPPYTYKGFCDSVLPDLTKAVRYARSKGVLVVAAAGNSGLSGVSIPGCISYSTTVGAVDNKDVVASFSGRGKAVSLTAPGVALYSAWLNGLYVIASGTSMATPIVSATVALVKSAHPAFTPAQTESAMFKTAKDLGPKGWDISYGRGRINAQGAVNYGS